MKPTTAPTEETDESISISQNLAMESSVRGMRQDDRRPAWEPSLPAGSDFSEEDTMVKRVVFDRLRKQGCHCPPEHYTPKHLCLIPGIRLQCIREIRRWQRYRHIVELMATGLPEELILGILEYVVCRTQPSLHLEHKRSLAMAARSIIGESPVIDQLQPLAEEAILSTSIITLNIAFQGDQTGKIAVLDPFVPTLQHPLRHLELPIRISIPAQRQAYPAALYIASAGVRSLLSLLPHLQTLRLIICITLDTDPRDRRHGVEDILSLSCRKGFSGTTTYKKAMVDLVDAARAAAHGPCVSLELRYESPFEDLDNKSRRVGHPDLDTYRVEAGARPALEVVEEAHSKHQW